MSETLDFILGGPQGAGLETSMVIISASLARLGYEVIADREYFSNIKGRHSYVHMRVLSKPLPKALSYPVKLVEAMDAETVFTHYGDLVDGGFLVYDKSVRGKHLEEIPSMESQLKERLSKRFKEIGVDGTIESLVKYLSREKKIRLIEINFAEQLRKLREKYKLSPAHTSRYISSILVGAYAGLTGLDLDAVEYGVNYRFKKNRSIAEQNIYLIKTVAEQVKTVHGEPLKIPPPSHDAREYMVVSGNEVVAMAKIVAGVRYQSYYPITPAADESFFLESHENLVVDEEHLGGILVFQTEDEIAAITSAIGAALTGARTATATSGPGFSLMVEGLGWAGHNEVPVVITYYQRGGPSTGLPTRGSQSDLLFTLFASHGEFPRIVIASGDHEEAFYDAIMAQNYAEVYQLPVIHLLDKFLANSITTMKPPDLSRVRIMRGEVVRGYKGYKRFDLSKPISPRVFLGDNTVMWYTGDEHDEYGHINEDPENRLRMYEKRMKKLELADKEIPVEFRVSYYGPRNPDYLLVGWGFVKNTVLDALRILEGENIKAGYLHLRVFSPFPVAYVRKMLEGMDGNIIAVEHNYLAQAARIIQMHTGVSIEKSVLKWTGRPIYTHELVESILDIIRNGRKRVVLSYGA